jgi:hypothetical protein
MKSLSPKQSLNLGHAVLKARQRADRKAGVEYSESATLRVHRALSWLGRAEHERDDPDTRFIHLWIAFNASYASGTEDPDMTERRAFHRFLSTLLKLDKKGRLGHLVWKEFSGNIRVLLDNQYVFADFWHHHNGKLTAAEWKDRLRASRRAAELALASNNTLAVLAIVFSRLYVLRNQIIHGGATWASKANRAQVCDCANLLGKVVPAIIEIMMDHPKQDWGKVVYPVVGDGMKDAGGGVSGKSAAVSGVKSGR